MYDLIIIGAGPAGLTAAIYARRAGKSVLVIEKSTFGGQMTFSPKIENYPGFESVSGNELADLMVSQAIALGAEIEPAEAESVTVRGGVFTVTADGTEYDCLAVVIAAGAAHRRLGLQGEDELVGNGISFCAVCDGAFYRDRHVAVIGGGNSALVEANLLAETCSRVTVIQNLPFLTGEQASADALLSHGNVRVIYNTVVSGYLTDGKGALRALKLAPAPGAPSGQGETGELEIDGCFVAIGLAPANGRFAGVAALDAAGYIDAGEDTRTSTPGIFAAGDCRRKAVRQITTAAADGAAAAIAACAYIDSSQKR